MVKEKTSINLTPKITKKADELVKSGQFANRSHAIRYTLETAWGLTKPSEPEAHNAPTPHPPE